MLLIKFQEYFEKIYSCSGAFIMNVESFVFLYAFYLAFLAFHFCRFSIIIIKQNIKELFAQNRGDIWILSDCNKIRTYNNFVRKQTLKHSVFIYEISGCGLESRYSRLQHPSSILQIVKPDFHATVPAGV